MRKTFLLLSLLCVLGAEAQTVLLSEDFETGNTGETPLPVAEGWTVQKGYTGDEATYNWYNYYAKPTADNEATITGLCCAAVSSPITATSGVGAREETLLSPAITLDDTYQLSFAFRVSPMNAYDASRYDLQVRVVEGDNLAGAETVFSIQNEQMMREAGLLTFPITTWDVYRPKVDLSDWRGETVRLAFVYKTLTQTANVAWLDDVLVRQFTPPTGPVASLSATTYRYGTMYIGEKHWSEPFRLTNTGKDGLALTAVDLPEGVGINIDPATVSLRANEFVDFQLSYTASLTSKATTPVVLHTTGGDLTLTLEAQKQFVPEGMTLETFETAFPPAGWRNNGWSRAVAALEGDQSAYAGGDYTQTYLRSPRLDLSDGGQLVFTYYNMYDGEEAPEYDIRLEVSNDNGDTWTTKWTSDYQNGLNKLLTDTVDLGLGSDESYVRWVYPAVETDDEGAYDHSAFTLDRVLLPHLYGAGGVPFSATLVAPANNAEGILPEDVVLKWGPAQFAEGYRLYVGTTSAANELIDGLDLGTALSYTIPSLAYETTYRWRVVPYNEVGTATTASTWRFTTQRDASVDTFPWEENFKASDVPEGWVLTPAASYARNWSVNSYYPYVLGDKEYNVLMSSWLNAGETNAATSPAFRLPEGKAMEVSFLWGDEHPSSLLVDPSGHHAKQNVEPDNGMSDCLFEVFADGAWTTLTHLSEAYADKDAETKYWISERVDLSPYAGKTIKLRWTHRSLSGNDSGTSLTHIVVGEQQGSKAMFNLPAWNAGKVNYGMATTSAETFTLVNAGTEALTVESATFATDNFSSTLSEGDQIAVGDHKAFTLRFDARETSAEVRDTLTVSFQGGLVATLPVSGVGLPADIYYYSFEPNALDYQWTDDFTMIDADNARGYSFSSYWVNYSMDGQKCAFSVESDGMDDGMYGMMAPVSGTHALVAASPQESCADNWIIARQRLASPTATFSFFARNWEDQGSVEPSAPHDITVLVSTMPTIDRDDFEVVMAKTTLPYLPYKEWQNYEVDLSAYAGQNIYVALRHTTDSPTNLAFFDDFCFSGFAPYDPNGIEGIKSAESGEQAVVYDLSGRRVSAKAKGLLIVGGKLRVASQF